MKRVALAAFVLVAGSAEVSAQGQRVAPSINAVPSAIATAAVAPADVDENDDPTDDRNIGELVASYGSGIWTWISYSFGSLFAAVTPPTPAAMVKKFQESDEKSTFFSMIGDCGYKIKEIENGIGLPPDVTVKFGRIRNLSDADIDYIDRELSRWEQREPGAIAGAQRAVITTLVSINQSDSYVVDSMRLRVLPLPQVKFSLAPTIGGLGWEGSQLMRAIQRLDRRVADFKLK